jgi:long-chain acyl-CoA synthetase
MRTLRGPLHGLLRRVLFSKVRESFGGNLEFFIGGGAYQDIETQRFFYALGIPLYQGYGLSEAAPVISTNTPDAHKLGSSGRIIPNLEVRICDPEGGDLPVGEKGEIVVKGENVMAGYWHNEEATAETIKDGWLFTGDLGYMDSDGFLYVLGREKSLLISGDGEKYSPEGIEEALCSNSPYIEQVMLHNDHDPYTVALLYPSRETLREWLKFQGLSWTTEEGQHAALGLLKDEIDAHLPGGAHGGMFAEQWLPSAFAVLGEGFTEENRHLNSTLKMVRNRITEYYRDRLDHLYTADGRDPSNRRNRTIISRLDD